MPNVSVVIPNYNHSVYLKKRIDSVLLQTYQDFEVIILDDNSTDDSRKIIEQYRANSKVSHIVYNVDNSGSTFRQWSKGISLAIGNLIWIAESDDLCEPSFLEELTPSFINGSVAIAFCQSLIINTDFQITSKTHANLLSEVMNGTEFVERHMLGRNTIINASMALFRRETALTISVPFTEMKYAGDWFFWVNLCLKGDVFISGKYLNYYLRHDSTVAAQAIRKGLSFLEGNKIYDFVVRNIPVSNQNKMAALKDRCDLYLAFKGLFLNSEIDNAVYQSILALDPSAKEIMQEKVRKLKRREVRGRIRRILNKFF